MTTTTQARHPEGTPVGGQFAATQRPGAEVDLTGPSSILNGRFHRIYERLVALEKLPSGGDEQLCARLRAQGLAAAVKDTFPTATTVVLEESDQLGSRACWVTSVQDAEGNELAGAYGEIGDYEDDLIDVLYDFQDQPIVVGPDMVGRPATPGLTMDGSEKHGYTYTVDVDAALAARPEQPATEVARSRAAALVSHYLAHYGDLDEDDPDEAVARDLLTDLHHWADSKGLDLHESFARAGEVAAEERREEAS